MVTTPVGASRPGRPRYVWLRYGADRPAPYEATPENEEALYKQARREQGMLPPALDMTVKPAVRFGEKVPVSPVRRPSDVVIPDDITDPVARGKAYSAAVEERRRALEAAAAAEDAPERRSLLEVLSEATQRRFGAHGPDLAGTEDRGGYHDAQD